MTQPFQISDAIRRAVIHGLSALLLMVSAAQAHFAEGTKVRTILVSIEDGALIAYVRAPAPLVFSDLVGRAQVDRVPLVSPFLKAETTITGTRYRLDSAAIARNLHAFEQRLSHALVFSQAGLHLPGSLAGFAIHDRRPATPPETGSQARAALATRHSAGAPLFGEAVIDYMVVLDSQDPAGILAIHAGYAPLLPGPGVAIDNHLIDARVAPPVSTTAPGQLETPVLMDGSRLSTFLHFVHQGSLHILEGLDHVLLVIALALGVGATRKLIYLVTAFTIGHSVTLIATFLGAAPDWPWFVPAVETAIAASVLYAAITAIFRKSGSIVIFAAIGLLHGLGFSFVLGDILGRDAPDLILALLAFNIGIELGQLFILAVTLAVVFGLEHFAKATLGPARVGTLTAIALLSVWWMIERLPGFVIAV